MRPRLIHKCECMRIPSMKNITPLMVDEDILRTGKREEKLFSPLENVKRFSSSRLCLSTICSVDIITPLVLPIAKI